MSHTSPNSSELEELQKEQPETIASSDDNPIDPVTGLNQRERDYIQKSWHHVRQDLKAAGQGFFQAFFKAHPDYQLKFKKFADVPADQLADNKSFQVHAMGVMKAVSMVVDSLDDIPKLLNELKNLGKSHGRHNINVANFRNLTVVLVAFLESALGPQLFPEDAKKSWIKALDVVVSVIATGLPQPSTDDAGSTM